MAPHDFSWMAYCERCGQRVWAAAHDRAGQHVGTPASLPPEVCAEPGYAPGSLMRRYIAEHGVSLPDVLMWIDDALVVLGDTSLTEREVNQLMVALRDAIALPPVCPLRTSQHWLPASGVRTGRERCGVDFQP